MFKRKQNFSGLGKESCFLWGPRQTGKSTLIKQFFPKAKYFDLLLASDYQRLIVEPGLMRQEIRGASPPPATVVIDEVQKIPLLLDEVQWLMVNCGIQFILCGSSARKLKRGRGNLLGGRALRYELFPLVYPEIPDFDLLRALNHGLFPRHYLAENPGRLLESYVVDYLREEIAEEALARNIPAFARFLESAAFSHGEIVNYQNIASECGVSPATVKEHLYILLDTLLGRFVFSFRKRPKRRVIHAPKFYFCDVGLIRFLLKRGKIAYRSESFGKAFEHFIFQELVAHSHYSGAHYEVTYWRTASQLEVDFILGDHEVALEIKGVEKVAPHHLRGLQAFAEEYRTKWSMVVSCDPHPRKVDGILILPWREFLEKLWGNKIIV